MTILTIAFLAAASLIICVASLMCGASRCSGCVGHLTKEELAEVIGQLPETAQVYITIEKG